MLRVFLSSLCALSMTGLNVCVSAAPVVDALATQASLASGSSGQAARSNGGDETPRSQQITEAGWRADDRIDIVSERGLETDIVEIHVPGASFIKLHFSKFELLGEVIVEVSNPSGTEYYRYADRQSDIRTFNPTEGDDGRTQFSAMSISGDTAIIRVLGKLGRINAYDHRLEVDYYMVGHPATEASRKNKLPEPLSQCGANDRVDAVCWEPSHPAEYARSLAVAKILIDGRSFCTAWRVGRDNFMMTNQHCIPSQSLAAATEVWFNYERTTCGGSVLRQEVKVSGFQLLASDATLDYSLFNVNDFDSISGFGHLGLDIEARSIGEGIFIPQHGGGLPKQMAIASDMNFSGLCEIDDISHDGYAEGSDLGYYCDTRNGSSGSPVVLRDNNRVAALHHLGGCVNSGAKMSLIWPQIADFFDGVVPDGSDDDENFPPQAQFSFACDELQCDFDAAGSSDVDGEVVGHDWDFGDGLTGSGVQLSHSFAAPGDYPVTLFVEDDGGATDSISQTVTVEIANASPLAAFSVNCDGTSCSFDASFSSDSDGHITDYHWSFGDGLTGHSTGPIIEHTYAVDGDYLVELTVVDDQGASGQAQSTITVTTPPDNEAPVADFSFICSELVCDFNASDSQDPDGSIVQYFWSFGDGESTESGGPLMQHGYSVAGNYTVTLEVTDDLGLTDTVETIVNVPPVTSAIDLNASTSKRKGQKIVALSWSGAGTDQVEVIRDGNLLSTTANDGEYTDDSLSKRVKSVKYQICETFPGTTCSDQIAVKF